MKKVTIINAYAGKNIGDAAILSVALSLINQTFPKNQTSLICEDTESFNSINQSQHTYVPYELPYGYAIRGKKKPSKIVKIIRFLTIYTRSFGYVLANKYLKLRLPKTGFYSYIQAIAQADLVVGIGGGYLITNHKIYDYFGLLLSLLNVYIAKLYKKKIVFLPISFGPFVTKTHEQLAFNAIKNTVVMCRDKITLRVIIDLDKKRQVNAFYAPDLALFYRKKEIDVTKKLESRYVVLTAREWLLDKIKQRNYENSLASFVNAINKKYNLNVLFIPMSINSVEDDDFKIAERIKSKVFNKRKFTVSTAKTIDELQDIIGNAKMAICTRMHSAILACTVGTPFIAIGYGHKTLGFVRSFNIEKWHIDIKEVDKKNVLHKFESLIDLNEYEDFRKKIHERFKSIHKYKTKIISNLN